MPGPAAALAPGTHRDISEDVYHSDLPGTFTGRLESTDELIVERTRQPRWSTPPAR